MPKLTKSGNKSDQGLKPGVNLSRKEMYIQIASVFPEALDVLVEVMRNGSQESARISAANKIIDKLLPNITQQELLAKFVGGEDNSNATPLLVGINRELLEEIAKKAVDNEGEILEGKTVEGSK